MKPNLLLASTHVFAVACSSSPSAPERICQVTADCGQIPEDQVDECTQDLEEVLADGGDRAADECADCAEDHTCAEIGQGECSASCGPLFAAIDSGLPEDSTVVSLSTA